MHTPNPDAKLQDFTGSHGMWLPTTAIACQPSRTDQGELAYPVHHMVLETTSRNQGSELSGATMTPQMTAAAALTRSGD